MVVFCDDLYALRLGSYKARFIIQDACGPAARERFTHEPPLLYQLDHDPPERFDVAAEHPGALTEIERLAVEHRATLTEAENQLDKRRQE